MAARIRARTCSFSLQSIVTLRRTESTISRAIVFSASSSIIQYGRVVLAYRVVEGDLVFAQAEFGAALVLVLQLLGERNQLGDHGCSIQGMVLVAQHRAGEHLRERPAGDEIALTDELDLLGEQPLEHLDLQVRVLLRS